MKNTLLIFVCTLIMCSCSSDDDNAVIDNFEVALIAQKSLYGGGSEGVAQQNLIISETNVWEELLTKLNSVNNVTFDFEETEIDFTKFTVVAVFDEVKPNGGYLIELDISKNNQNIIVEVIDVYPNGGATTIISQPFHIVKITKSNMPIVFQ